VAKKTKLTKEQKLTLQFFSDIPVGWDTDMALYTTIKSGGRADALIEVQTIENLTRLINWLKAQQIPWRTIGRGSNILVSSQGFNGVIIKLTGEFESILYLGDKFGNHNEKAIIRVGSGCPISTLLSWSIKNSYTDLEFLAGIPGSIGGAIHMNAGAFGHCTAEIIDSITILDSLGHQKQISGEDIEFDYRHMSLKDPWINEYVIIAGFFGLRKGNKDEIKIKCRNNIKKRNQQQPLAYASAGSFFKNPAGDSAGRLIEAAGLKGLRKGDAMVSNKHANFIVNTGKATATDITDLMKEIQKKVFLNSGIRLEPEVKIL